MNFLSLLSNIMRIYNRPNQYNDPNYNMYQNPVEPNKYSSNNFMYNDYYKNVNNYYKEKVKGFLYKQI